jgi:hypothetical protein
MLPQSVERGGSSTEMLNRCVSGIANRPLDSHRHTRAKTNLRQPNCQPLNRTLYQKNPARPNRFSGECALRQRSDFARTAQVPARAERTLWKSRQRTKGLAARVYQAAHRAIRLNLDLNIKIDPGCSRNRPEGGANTSSEVSAPNSRGIYQERRPLTCRRRAWVPSGKPPSPDA